MKQKKNYIYLIGICGWDHLEITSAHKSYKGAMKAWNKIRLNFLKETKEFLKLENSKINKDFYKRGIKDLSCKEPEKMHNHAGDQPYMQKIELQD